MSEVEWQAEVQWAGKMVFLGSDEKGHTIVYDSSDDGVNRGISPMRSLLTSLGACSGMDVVALLSKRKQKLTSLRVLVKGDRPKSGYPRPYNAIDVKYLLSGDGLKKEFVEDAVNQSMEKFCSVAATLRPGVTINYSYELVQT